MTVLSRKIASIPVRSASQTWLRIVDLVAPAEGDARVELLAAAGVAASLVAREAMAASPIVVAGEGPRLRLYCVHGEAAIEGTNVNEAALPESPIGAGSWTVSLPCPEEDLSWIQASLKRISNRITARDQEDRFSADPDERAAESKAYIDPESFLRP
jgi:hypothetical protein